ncbi:hypothetical protein [Streptomyces sp. WAC06614]|uniref:hypothetical protein n=1 Tax=Streptomyces sp. WAC06614 TaxID=2487416 RepID=UPI00163D36A9|nr:hypothetical protein [Streptomyces sp. WAC06614]
MICPHCEKNLLQKERAGNVCSHCRRRYALDPKTNPMKLHDLRVRRVVQQLQGDGEVAVTTGQLWYALARKQVKESGVDGGCIGGALGFGVFLGLFGLLADVGALIVLAVVLALIGCGGLVARLAGVGKGVARMTHEQFRAQALGEWRSVYGALPGGVTDEALVEPYRSSASDTAVPSAVLVCPQRSIAAFLAANGVPERCGLVLVPGPEALRALPEQPGRLPVLVLHDADVDGELLVHRIRQEAEATGRRVVDAGLPLRTVREQVKGVAYRDKERRPGAEQLRLLAALGTVGPAELDRLAKGWRFPLVAVPPQKLLDHVARLTDEVGRQADPVRRRAAAVGFMTWPGPGRGAEAGAGPGQGPAAGAAPAAAPVPGQSPGRGRGRGRGAEAGARPGQGSAAAPAADTAAGTGPTAGPGPAAGPGAAGGPGAGGVS